MNEVAQYWVMRLLVKEDQEYALGCVEWWTRDRLPAAVSALKPPSSFHSLVITYLSKMFTAAELSCKGSFLLETRTLSAKHLGLPNRPFRLQGLNGRNRCCWLPIFSGGARHICWYGCWLIFCFLMTVPTFSFVSHYFSAIGHTHSNYPPKTSRLYPTIVLHKLRVDFLLHRTVANFRHNDFKDHLWFLTTYSVQNCAYLQSSAFVLLDRVSPVTGSVAYLYRFLTSLYISRTISGKSLWIPSSTTLPRSSKYPRPP